MALASYYAIEIRQVAAPCSKFIKPSLANVGALRDGDVLMSVYLFVRLPPVKFIKSFAMWQHLAASGKSYRLQYTCFQFIRLYNLWFAFTSIMIRRLGLPPEPSRVTPIEKFYVTPACLTPSPSR